MSVLKAKRGQSKAEYVNTARKIKVETRAFLSKLSARYARLDAADVMHLAREVADLTEQANSMMPTDEVRYKLRLELLLKAHGSLAALDADLLDIYLGNYDEHGKVLELRRMFYRMYGFSCEKYENFSRRQKQYEIRRNQTV